MTAAFSSLIAAAAPVLVVLLTGCLPQPRVADSNAVALPAQPQRQQNPGVLVPPLRFNFDSVRQRSQNRLKTFLEARASDPTFSSCPILDRMKTWKEPAIPPVPMPNIDPTHSAAIPMPNAMTCGLSSQLDSLRALVRLRSNPQDTIVIHR